MRRSRVAEEAATSARFKLLRAIIEHDLFSSDSSDDDEEGGDERSRRDELGRFRRVGGYHPRPAQNPEGTGKEKWCHPYKAGKLWKLMHKETVLDDKSYWGKKWRRITGVPMKLFQDIVAEAACHDELREKDLTDPKRGTAPVPLKLKIGGVCIWIRQGCTMEFAAEFAELDTETLRRFAKAYLLIFVQHEYPKFVHWPKGDELRHVLQLHAKLGFPGCAGFTDGVAVRVDSVPSTLREDHKGKEQVVVRNFNVTGSVARRIFHVFGSVAGGINDKNMADYDEYMQACKANTLAPDAEWQMYTLDAAGQVLVVKMKGKLWLLTDNGFNPWPCIHFPQKYPASNDIKLWSAYGESARKPGSECIYGIIKKRFLLFQNAWHFRGVRLVRFDDAVRHMNNAFRFACALHNRLQDYDGIGDLGAHEADFKSVHAVAMLRAMVKPVGVSLPPCVAGASEEPHIAPCMLHKRNFEALVQHFTIAHKRSEVRWLRKAKASRNHRVDLRPLGYGHKKYPHLAPEAGEDDDDENDRFDREHFRGRDADDDDPEDTFGFDGHDTEEDDE